MACHPMMATYIFQGWFFFSTDFPAFMAAGVKTATRWDIYRVGDLPFQQNLFFDLLGMCRQGSGNERLAVGVQRIFKQFAGFGKFHKFT